MFVVAEVEVAGAAEVVRARARHDVDRAERRNARRQVEVRGRDLELLNDFLREVLARAAFNRIADVAAVHRDRRARRRAAQNRHVELRVELRRIPEVHGHARLQRGEVQEAAAVQREVLDLRPPDDALHPVRYRDPLASPSPITVTASVLLLTCSVDFDGGRRTGGHVHWTDDRLESRRLDDHVVRAGRQRRHRERSVHARLHDAGRARIFVRDSDGRTAEERRRPDRSRCLRWCRWVLAPSGNLTA